MCLQNSNIPLCQWGGTLVLSLTCIWHCTPALTKGKKQTGCMPSESQSYVTTWSPFAEGKHCLGDLRPGTLRQNAWRNVSVHAVRCRLLTDESTLSDQRRTRAKKNLHTLFTGRGYWHGVCERIHTWLYWRSREGLIIASDSKQHGSRVCWVSRALMQLPELWNKKQQVGPVGPGRKHTSLQFIQMYIYIRRLTQTHTFVHNWGINAN